MTSDHASGPERLDEILADYLQRVEAGEQVDRNLLLQRYPEFADELNAFFTDDSQLRRAADNKSAINTPTIDSSPGRTAGLRLEPTFDSQAPADKTRPRGQRIGYFGDYELLEEIARGGMGVVYKARQANLNRLVALKMILSGQLASEQDVKRFHQEAEAAAHLNHPGIVPIYEVGQHAGQHFFSMGLVEGDSLAKRVVDGPLPPREAAQLVHKIADAVQYAHDRGVVHRDLKPANVLLDKHGDPKVTDFGLAKRAEGASQLTGTGQILGTPGYMPPEQASGRADDIGPAADIYSLGALLYCLLTGRPPFQAATVLDTLKQVIGQEPAPPRQLNPLLPRDLETICLKCLQKEPRQRYESAQALADELGRYLGGEPIQARPAGPLERTWRWCRRNPKVAALTALVAASLAMGTAVSSYYAVQAGNHAQAALQLADQKTTLANEKTTLANEKAALAVQEHAARQDAEARKRQAERAQRKTARHLYLAHMNLAQRAWRDGNVRRLLELLEAQRPDRTGGDDLRGFEWHYWWKLCHSELLTINARDWIRDLACSPDGKLLASAGWRLHLWDAETGKQIHRLEGHEGKIETVAFSPDSRFLVSAGEDKTVRFWDVQTGERLRAFKGSQYPVYDLAFHPQGHQLASGGGDSDTLVGEIHVWDVRNGSRLTAAPEAKLCVYSVAYSPDGKVLASGNRGGRIKLWDTHANQELAEWSGGNSAVTTLAFSPDGQRLACAGWWETIRICNTMTGKEAVVLEGFSGHTHDLAFHPDGIRLASGGADQTVRVWDTFSGQLLHQFRGHREPVQDIAFRPGPWHVVSASSGGTIKTWGGNSDQEKNLLAGLQLAAHDLAFSPDQEWLACAEGMYWAPEKPGAVQLWQVSTLAAGPRLAGHHGGVFGVAFSPDSSQLATASADGTVALWNVAAGTKIKTIAAGESSFWSVAFSPDGRRLAAGSADTTVQVWDVSTGKRIHVFQGHGQAIKTLAFCSEGRYLAAASWHGSTIWEVETGDQILNLQQGGTTGLAFGSDNKLLACAVGRNVRQYEIKTGKQLLNVTAHSSPSATSRLARTVSDWRPARTTKQPSCGTSRLARR